jgi:hypothetical protein
LDEEEFGLGDGDDTAAAPALTTKPTMAVSAATEKNDTSAASKPAKVPATAADAKNDKFEPKTTSIEDGESNGKETTAKADASAETSNEFEKSAAEVTSDLSFEAKKRQRAKRFGIPVVSTAAKDETTKEPKRQKKATAETAPAQAEEKPLLSMEEIDKQLERAQKYGVVDQAKIDELKAMKRKYRFT